MKLEIKMTNKKERFSEIEAMWINGEIKYSHGAASFTHSFCVENRDELEDLESHIESIAFAIRDFRMKNFPESESIDE